MAIIPSDEKVFMVDKRTNTVYGGSAALQAMQQWYTMQDVIDSVRPYKVFTALLTQSGGSDELNQSSGSLTKGVSYYFNGTGGASADFSNVGVANVVDGEWFIATQTAEPINWDGWNVSFNTGAPVATVLENTIGNIWFTYGGVGNYSVNSNDLFILNKTFVINGTSSNNNNSKIVTINGEFANSISLNTINDLDIPSDDLLYNTSIEIRVYN